MMIAYPVFIQGEGSTRQERQSIYFLPILALLLYMRAFTRGIQTKRQTQGSLERKRYILLCRGERAWCLGEKTYILYTV